VSSRLPIGTSFRGGSVPTANVVGVSDFLLIHGNGVTEPARIARMVEETRMVRGYKPMPIMFNEDDHFDFERPLNNFTQAVSRHASWGYFDPGTNTTLKPPSGAHSAKAKRIGTRAARGLACSR
jgi:hypothetical protein